MEQNQRAHLSGKSLYGDDLTPEDIHNWYEHEREAYADLWVPDTSEYSYEYHALNLLHGFHWLPKRTFHSLCSIGGAMGDELAPVVEHLKRDPLALRFAARKCLTRQRDNVALIP